MKVLNKDEYHKANKLLGSLPINTLFAQSVANHSVSGSIFVDDSSSPGTFYIAHPYGMSLLLGETTNRKFNEWLYDYLTNRQQKRVKDEWLQVFPAEWNLRLEEILGPDLIKQDPYGMNTVGKVTEYTRVNFKFNRSKYQELRKNIHLPPDYELTTEKKVIYENMPGSVVPRHFWNNAQDFADRARAFALIHQGEIISTAFSSFLIDRYLEIGIETVELYRGRGYASHLCSLLIDDCIRHGFEPVWACRSDNAGSYGLAVSLGFEPAISIPYYKLVK